MPFQIFFRNSDLEVGENIDLGDNVEFTIQTRNGKEVATNIIKLVAGTVVFEDVGTEYFRGQVLKVSSKLYITSTLNIDLILWNTQLIVCAENVKSWFKSWVISLTFQAYILPHTLNCMCVSLFKFHI